VGASVERRFQTPHPFFQLLDPGKKTIVIQWLGEWPDPFQAQRFGQAQQLIIDERDQRELARLPGGDVTQAIVEREDELPKIIRRL